MKIPYTSRQCVRCLLILLLLALSTAFVPLCHPSNMMSCSHERRFLVPSATTSSITALHMAYEPHVPNYCSECGAAEMSLKIPPGDERLRAVCGNCGFVHYSNPKIVVACVVLTTNNKDDRILLAKRAIEPRKGTWGIPQGFMEHGETTRQAAAREVLEETGAIVDPNDLEFRALYNVPGSVQLVYTIQVDATQVESQVAGYNTETGESSQVELVPLQSVVDKELCFPTVQWALDHCLKQKNVQVTRIQQMTKYYDDKKQVWGEFEDEAEK